MVEKLINSKNEIRLKTEVITVGESNEETILVIEIDGNKKYFIHYIDDTLKTDLSRFILTEETFGEEIKCSNFVSTLLEELERQNIGYSDFYTEHMEKLKHFLNELGLTHNTVSIYEDVLDEFLVGILY